jgi:predicted enzyme related to lactoylglutathione lyase
MAIKGIYLAWIVVNDLKAAVKFYTEVVGLKVQQMHEEFGWAELGGSEEKGAILGIAQKSEHEKIQPGQNAVVTLSVSDLVKSKNALSQKGAKMLGEVIEIPGHAKLQMVVDQDGNHFQLVESLENYS